MTATPAPVRKIPEDAKPEWPDTPAFLRLYVDDCDTTYRQALRAEIVPSRDGG